MNEKSLSLPNSINQVSKLSIRDKFGVFFWRNIAMPAIAAIGGKKFPEGKVTEYVYGELRDEKLDFIAPNKVSEKRFAIVHIHGGAWNSRKQREISF